MYNKLHPFKLQICVSDRCLNPYNHYHNQDVGHNRFPPTPSCLGKLFIGGGMHWCKLSGGNEANTVRTFYVHLSSPASLTCPSWNTEACHCPRTFACAVLSPGWLFLQVAVSSLPSGLYSNITLSGRFSPSRVTWSPALCTPSPLRFDLFLGTPALHICLPLLVSSGLTALKQHFSSLPPSHGPERGLGVPWAAGALAIPSACRGTLK